jgi:hypothetical protein
MFMTTARKALLDNGRQKLLSLCLLGVLAATASVRAEQSAGTSSAPANIVAVDPNGFEVDGAGAVENEVSFETADETLLLIWAALALTMFGIAVADLRAARQSTNAVILGELDSNSAH